MAKEFLHLRLNPCPRLNNKGVIRSNQVKENKKPHGIPEAANDCYTMRFSTFGTLQNARHIQQEPRLPSGATVQITKKKVLATRNVNSWKFKEGSCLHILTSYAVRILDDYAKKKGSSATRFKNSHSNLHLPQVHTFRIRTVKFTHPNSHNKQ